MDEAKPVHGRADHRRSARAGSWDESVGGVPQARHLGADVLRLEGEVRWHEHLGARRLKQLEEENAKLKKHLAEAMLDNAVLKDITSRKW